MNFFSGRVAVFFFLLKFGLVFNLYDFIDHIGGSLTNK